MWPTQEIKKPLQLEAYLCVNYLTRVDLNKSETRFSMCSFLTRVIGNNSKFKRVSNFKLFRLGFIRKLLKSTISSLLLVKVVFFRFLYAFDFSFTSF